MKLLNQSSTIPLENKTPKITAEEHSGSLPGRYYDEELKIHKRVNNTAIGILIAGFVLICISLIAVIATGRMEIGLVSSIAGVLTEYFSVNIFKYVARAGEDKWKYFGALSAEKEEQRIIELIDSSENPEFRDSMISKMVDTFCENKKNM